MKVVFSLAALAIVTTAHSSIKSGVQAVSDEVEDVRSSKADYYDVSYLERRVDELEGEVEYRSPM